MARKLLIDAADEVDTAKEAIPDPEARDRLDTLASQLRSQANREATPGLGELDRILVKLRDIEGQTDEPTVTEAIGRARDDILALLATLDDRGMKQHDRTENKG